MLCFGLGELLDRWGFYPEALGSFGTKILLQLKPTLPNIVIFGLSFTGLHTLIKMFRFPLQPIQDLMIYPFGPSVLANTRSPLQSMWDPPIHPLWGPNVLVVTLVWCPSPLGLSLLADTLFGFDTICNNPSLRLADIVLFGLSLMGFPSRFQNASARKRFSHP